MTKLIKTQKQVQVLATYIFSAIDRVCFVVRSSNGADTYNTCFDQGHGSCTCPGGKYNHCYHLTQLQPRYEAIKAERAQKDSAVNALLTAMSVCGQVAHLAKGEYDAMERDYTAMYDAPLNGSRNAGFSLLRR